MPVAPHSNSDAPLNQHDEFYPTTMRTALNIILAAFTLALLTPPAHATYTLVITETDSSTGSSVTTTVTHDFGTATAGFTDVAGTTAGVNGKMIYSGTLGAVLVRVTTAVEMISPTDVKLQLSNMDLTTHTPGAIDSSAPASLSITLTQDGNTLATTGPTSAALNLLSGGTLGPGVSFTTSATMTPSGGATTLSPLQWTENGTTTVPGDTVNNTTGTNSYSTTASAPVGLGGSADMFTLSLTDQFTFTATGSVSSFNSTAEATVPEPASLAIIVSGLPLLGFSALRRRRKKAAVA